MRRLVALRMDIGRLSGFIAISAIAAVGAAVASAEGRQASWHAPETIPELALNRILKLADSDRDQLDNLFGGRGAKNFRQTIDYTTTLTAPLRAAIRSAEDLEVKNSCGGSYTPGELCGLDFSPISCTQDYNDVYLYETTSESEYAALVSYTWPRDEQPIATYKLIKESGHWKIDGIRCGPLGIAFHMP